MSLRFVVCALALSTLLADGDASSVSESQREALGRLQSYVGQWRGVGQVRRGSRNGAWIETADCAWDLSNVDAALEIKSPKAKFFPTMRFESSRKENAYRMVGLKKDGAKTVYEGKLDNDGVLHLDATTSVDGLPDRLQIRLAAEGKRLVVLYQRRISASRYSRLAEVGFTRKGSGFGSGANFVECIVTGGKGTIPVSFEGKTFYVCCSGCKEYFDDDPAKVVAEYKERVAERKAEKSRQQ